MTRFAMVVLAVVGCGRGVTLHADLPQADGVTVGMPVRIAGVEVGAVEGLNVAGDRVRMELHIDARHDLALHADACLDLEADAIVVQPGTTGELGDAALEVCEPAVPDVVDLLERLVPDARELGDRIGKAAREFTDGLGAGLGDPRELGRDIGTMAHDLEAGIDEGIAGPQEARTDRQRP